MAGYTTHGEGGSIRPNAAQDGKVDGFESYNMESSNLGSYEDTSEEFNADDARRHRSIRKFYIPDVLLLEFFLDLS